jgi:hypothetical protein
VLESPDVFSWANAPGATADTNSRNISERDALTRPKLLQDLGIFPTKVLDRSNTGEIHIKQRDFISSSVWHGMARHGSGFLSQPVSGETRSARLARGVHRHLVPAAELVMSGRVYDPARRRFNSRRKLYETLFLCQVGIVVKLLKKYRK